MTKAPNDLSELDFLIQARELETNFLEAKKNQAKDPDAYREAKYAFHEFRSHWRGIREYVQAAGSGTATPSAIEADIKES